MATKKRKTTTRRAASRKKRAEQRLPAGLGTLFAGLLLVVLAFVEGDSAWKALHDVLFGLFGCGSFVLGAAVCCLAVQYTRGEDLLPKIFKLVLGLVFACGTMIVFSDIQPQGMSAFQMTAACYANGVNAWIGGGALGALLGGSLLLLCGRPAATLIMIVLALCVSLYIFDLYSFIHTHIHLANPQNKPRVKRWLYLPVWLHSHRNSKKMHGILSRFRPRLHESEKLCPHLYNLDKSPS